MKSTIKYLPSSDPLDPLYRLSVEFDPDTGLTTVAEEEVANASRGAMVTGYRAAIDLSREQLIWLAEALQDAVMEREGEDVVPASPLELYLNRMETATQAERKKLVQSSLVASNEHDVPIGECADATERYVGND